MEISLWDLVKCPQFCNPRHRGRKHKVTMICFQWNRSFASCYASPHAKPISFSSAITVRQKNVDRPCFLLSGGVHRGTVQMMRSWSILRTCASHRIRRRRISSTLHILAFRDSSSYSNTFHFFVIFLRFASSRTQGLQASKRAAPLFYSPLQTQTAQRALNLMCKTPQKRFTTMCLTGRALVMATLLSVT